LEVAKKCDFQTKNDIMENMKYFELLLISKEALKNKIPVKIDPNNVKNCPEALNLRKDLDQLEILKEKAMQVINSIFNALNEDNIVPQMISVLQKKTTEKTIIDNAKSKFESMFKELESISEEIKILKLGIKTKNEVFIRAKQANKTNEENDKVLISIKILVL
jgi:hypothetical protein